MTPPLRDVLLFGMNNENWFLLKILFLLLMITFPVAQSVEVYASNLWVAGSNLAPVLLFISFVGFYKCTYRANIIDFDMFRTVVVIIF